MMKWLFIGGRCVVIACDAFNKASYTDVFHDDSDNYHKLNILPTHEIHETGAVFGVGLII